MAYALRYIMLYYNNVRRQPYKRGSVNLYYVYEGAIKVSIVQLFQISLLPCALMTNRISES